MARVGRFGNLPAKAPDLSATIVAMLEAYENQRDRNIQTAWEQGGQFEGGKVTDEKYLNFIRDRMQSVSRDDPMYDYWQQTFFSTRFAIAEQKAALAYQRENWDEGDMAAFYRREAQKVPRHSAAWRDLMTNAARFAKAAKAARSASNAAARAEAAERAWKAADRQWIRPARIVEDALHDLAVRKGWIAEEESVWSLNMAEGEVVSFNDLLAEVETAPNWPEVRRRLQASDPNFNGRLTMEYARRSFERAKRGTNEQIDIGRRMKYSTWVDAAKKEKQQWNGRATSARVWDVAVDYAQARQTFIENGGVDPTATAAERAADRADYDRSLARLEDRFARSGDNESAGKIHQERLALAGKVDQVGDDASFWEDWYGTGAKSGTNKATATLVDQELDQLSGLAAGTHVQVLQDDNGRAIPTIVPSQTVVAQYPDGAAYLVRSTKASQMTAADGTLISVPATTYTEVRTRIPIVVQIPNPIYWDPMTQDLTTTSFFTPSAQTSSKVGYIIPERDGTYSYEMFTGPGGETTFTDIDPFQSGSVLQQGMANGIYTVIADPNWNPAGGQGGLGTTWMTQWVDPTTGLPTTEGAEGAIETEVAQPRSVLRPELGGYQPPAAEPEAVQPGPRVTPGMPTSEQARNEVWDLTLVRDQLARVRAGEPAGEGVGARPPDTSGSMGPLPETELPGEPGSLPGQEDAIADLEARERELTARVAQGGLMGQIPLLGEAARTTLYQQMGVRAEGDAAPVDPVTAVNQIPGYSTYTTMSYATDQQRRREFTQMDPTAVWQTLLDNDPGMTPERMRRAAGEIIEITRGAQQDERAYAQTRIALAGTPFDNPVMTGLLRLMSPSVAQVAGNMARGLNLPVGRETAEERAARERRTEGFEALQRVGAVPTPWGFVPLEDMQARQPRPETAQPALNIPLLPQVPGMATAAATEAALLQQRQQPVRSVTTARPTVRPDQQQPGAPLGQMVRPTPSRAIQIKTPEPPPPPQPPMPPPPVPTTPRTEQERQRRERAARGQYGGGRGQGGRIPL